MMIGRYAPLLVVTCFEALKGKTLLCVEAKEGDKTARFYCADGSVLTLMHRQDCCESVTLRDVVGDLSDLVGPVVEATETTAEGEPSPYIESRTWTYYRVSCAGRGTVTLAWEGTSNGYYSEAVEAFWGLVNA